MASNLPSDPSIDSARADFLAFLTSLFLSRFADQVLLFLVPLVVFQTTGDVGWSGLAFALETFPRFLSFPICGALCDRVSPVLLLHWSQVLRAVACVAGAIGGEAFGGVAWLVGVSAVCGVLTTQGVMAREVILPQGFTTYRFEKVLAYSQTADPLGAVLGPLVAALLLTSSRWQAVLGETAIVFILADGAMRYWQHKSNVRLNAPGDAPAGWSNAMKRALTLLMFVPELRRLIIQAAGVNLVVGVTLASSAVLVTGTHARSTGYYGALQAAGAVVTVLVLLVIARLSVPVHKLGITAFGALLLGGAMTALCDSSMGYAAGYLLVIGFDKMFNIYLRSSRQRVIPVSDYGKTTGLMTLLNNSTQPVAGLAIGAFATTWNADGVILLATAGMLVLGCVSVALRGRPRN